MPDESTTLETLRRYVDSHPFLAEMGFSVESLEDGELRAAVPYDERYGNPPMVGTDDETYANPPMEGNGDGNGRRPLHGGIISTVLDSVMGLAVYASTLAEGRQQGPTLSLSTEFVAAATGPLEAVAEPVSVGRSTATVRGELHDAETGEVVAVGQGVWRVYS